MSSSDEKEKVIVLKGSTLKLLNLIARAFISAIIAAVSVFLLNSYFHLFYPYSYGFLQYGIIIFILCFLSLIHI